MDEGLVRPSITALSRNTSAVLLPTSLPFLPTVNQLSKPTVRPALSLDDVSSLCQQFSHRAFSSITVVSVTHMDVHEEYSHGCVSKAQRYRAHVDPPSADIILFSCASVPALQCETDIVRQQTELEDRNPSCWLVAQKLAVLELHRMLAFSGAFTSVLLCQLIGFCKWEHIDQEKSIASQLGCPFIETSSHHPRCPPLLLHPRASIHTHTPSLTSPCSASASLG